MGAGSSRSRRDGARGGRHRRRDREDRGVRRLSLRPRWSSLLHQARAGAASLGGDARRGAARPGRGSRGSTTAAASSTTRCGRRTSSKASASSSRCAARLLLLLAAQAAVHASADLRGLGGARFGRRLYDAFFRSYTEKVWGIPGRRSRPSGLRSESRSSASGTRCSGILGLERGEPTTLIEEFLYPRLGPGQMWEAFARCGRASAGSRCCCNHRCVAIRHDAGRVESVVVRKRRPRAASTPVDAVLSSIPLAELVESLDPPAPRARARGGRRSCATANLCLVALMTHEPEPFPDNWIYLHDPRTRAGRVQNFGAWSPDMVPRRDHLPRGRVLLLRG